MGITPLLQSLNLSKTAVSDRIATLLQKYPQLGVVTLSDITELRFRSVDFPERTIEELGKAEQVTFLTIRQSSLSAQEVARLREELPHCRIYHSSSK